MREIKFRVFNKTNKNFDFNKIIIEPKIQTNIVDLTTSDTSEIIFHQFTGLTDKNNKEIYEGDILDYEGTTHIVKYDVEQAGFRLPEINKINNQPPIIAKLCEFIAIRSRIIGNIFENPELLENAR